MNLLNRLSISRKLLLLTVLVLIAISIPSFFHIRQSWALADAAQSELNGLVPARQLIKLVQITQQHRGLSAAFLGGNAQVQAAREAKSVEVKQQFDKLKPQLVGALMTESMRETWEEAQSQWNSLSGEVGAKSLKAGVSSTRHAQLIAIYFKLLDQMVDQSGLILDPEAASYFLVSASLIKLPMATEALGQTRARGAGFLAEGQIGPEGRTVLAGLVQQASDHHASMVGAFEKSFHADPTLKKALGDKIAELGNRVTTSLQITRQELIAKDELKFSAPDYIASYTQTIDAMFASDEAALDALEGLLTQRVKDLHASSWWVMVLLCLMMLGIYFMSRSISKSITLPLRRAVALAQQIAERDLNGSVENSRNDEIGQLTGALLTMRDSLRGVIGEVRGNADQVARASQELAQGNNDLSQRTEQQASALQQTVSSMDQLTSTVRSNADQAADASKLAQRACQVVLSGGEAVDKIVTTMGGIEASSRKIEEIISVIDSIAFQTNILALNAAVEAARAGEQGRGFAVVASEVRVLAQRSAEAAKQIKILIAASVTQVEAGTRLVGGAGSTMHEAVSAIRSLSEMVVRISQASSEQSGGLVQISQAVSHMDQLTQQNAALVEETAAAGVGLQDQAHRLAVLVGTFKVAEARAN
ncbi:methyl-accepting chemotaxis protein [Roseateles koreensis]|uniref:Methyl-accepting chemotaxis protein n=1 Tax=Roseateles koreensis TaxID=2987526 RepID=A0ABT5KU07_9BURK|nr:methyl-accepting chemotaxis protein [Roseateles koreensis]MDC8786409.1 methyl-accepting chemotaxis protein [Roseateles koreensis]